MAKPTPGDGKSITSIVFLGFPDFGVKTISNLPGSSAFNSLALY
jgi:hypothetical protein